MAFGFQGLLYKYRLNGPQCTIGQPSLYGSPSKRFGNMAFTHHHSTAAFSFPSQQSYAQYQVAGSHHFQPAGAGSFRGVGVEPTAAFAAWDFFPRRDQPSTILDNALFFCVALCHMDPQWSGHFVSEDERSGALALSVEAVPESQKFFPARILASLVQTQLFLSSGDTRSVSRQGVQHVRNLAASFQRYHAQYGGVSLSAQSFRRPPLAFASCPILS